MVTSSDGWIVPYGGSGGHVEGFSHLCSSAPDGAFTLEFTTVSDERGQADQGGDLAPIKITEFGQVGDQAEGGLWPDA